MKKLTKILLLLLLLSAIRYPLNATYAAVLHLINYQGRLTDTSGAPLNGSYAVTFRIYDSETAGTLLWEETHPGVVITKGIFSILLGSVTNLDLAFDRQYWLEIKLGTEVMTLRQKIASSAYAIRAEEAEIANSLPQDVILMCKGACPAGYRRIGVLDGKFLVGGQNYNLTAGGSNAVTLSVNNLPAHTHSINHGHNLNNPMYQMGPSEYKYRGLDYSGGGAGQSIVDYSGNSGATGTGESFDNRPEFATVVLCEKE